MMTPRLSRRAFMRGLSAAATVSPFAHLAKSARAQEASGPPQRLLLIFTPHGACPEFWRPQQEGDDWSISYDQCVLSPLAPLKDKICVVDGLDFRVLYDGSLIVGDRIGHGGGMATLFTGTVPNSLGGLDLIGAGPSVDQTVADFLVDSGQQTPHRSLELSVGTASGVTVYDSMIHTGGDGSGQRVQGTYDPAFAFDRLFGSLTADDGGQSQLLRSSRRAAAFQFALSDLARLQSSLGVAEQQKLELHAESIHQLQQTLSSTSSASSCAAPNMSGVALDPLAAANHPAVSSMMSDILVEAFACDLVRVASLQFHFAAGFDPLPWLDIHTDPHESLSHHVYSGPETLTTDNDVIAKYVAMQTWYSQQVANLLTKLDAIEDPGGGSVLDNTLVVWGNELGDPVHHSNINVPFVVAGGLGKIQMGRWLRYSDAYWPWCNPPWGDCPDDDIHAGQTAHNHLLVSVCQAMGMEVETFGSSWYSGGLDGLLTG